jgi:predicted nucleic acid-binding Zn ribbon protein
MARCSHCRRVIGAAELVRACPERRQVYHDRCYELRNAPRRTPRPTLVVLILLAGILIALGLGRAFR